MRETEHEVEVIDCKDCPHTDIYLPSSIQLSNVCKNCPLIKNEYDRLRVKTKLITKEYDKKGNLLSIEPFFIDVRFGQIFSDLNLPIR